MYALGTLKKTWVPISTNDIILFVPYIMLAHAPALTANPSAETTDDAVSLEVKGEVGLKVYVNGVASGTLNSQGKLTVTLNTSGHGGDKIFTITLKDNSGHNSESLTVTIKKIVPCITLDELKSKIAYGYDVTQVNTGCIQDMSWLFSPPRFQAYTYFNQDISGWDVSNVTNMDGMFRYAINFNQDISGWDVSNVTSMYYMFFAAENFNQPLNDWDVSNVTSMYYMFASGTYGRAGKFNQALNNWDVSNVTNMSNMFYNTENFNQPLNDWDVSNVTSMYYMFAGAQKFNQPLNDWDVSNVTNMSNMFYVAQKFNQALNNWDVSNVTNMRWMFFGARTFDKDISHWNVNNVINNDSFSYNSPLRNSYNPFK